ncbi:hypothetical protein [Tabrizicola sp.]|uniref:hypothetical protein n=1 Tax=Tabrizicola sp. TaxID=2005166 RepID=UPI002736EC92|nr:hypothetical protein [Tabrizicola sp.]MDP3196318.1 hypothetical protein [Tabrizicola sp.]
MSRLLLPALVAAFALPATAQDTGLSFGGEIKLEYLDGGSDEVLALDGDIGMSWRSGGLLGFDAALDTTRLDDGSDFTNIWAALVLSTGAGEFAVGAPRPLSETERVMPRFSSSRLLDLESSFLRGSIASLASSFDRGMTPGITWKQDAGSLSFGAGYHHMNDRNADVAEGFMHYAAGATTFFITGEFATAPGPDLSLMQIGAFHDADRFDIGAALAQYDAADTRHTVRLYGSVDVMTALTLRGDMLMVQDASDIYSISATYSLDNGLFVEGGGTKVTGSDELFDIGVGYKF